MSSKHFEDIKINFTEDTDTWKIVGYHSIEIKISKT